MVPNLESQFERGLPLNILFVTRQAVFTNCGETREAASRGRFRAAGPAHSWRFGAFGIHETAAEVATGFWFSNCGLRRIELVQSGFSEVTLSNSPYQIPRFHLADRCRICVTQSCSAESLVN